MGAIGLLQPTVARHVEAELIVTFDGMAVAEWNDADGRTHAEVLEAIDRTIARMEAEPQ
jgi:hypothetical protein